VLVRINAQVPPIEAALTRAGIVFRVRGQRFFERPEVREALRLLRRLPASARAEPWSRSSRRGCGWTSARPGRGRDARRGTGTDGVAGARARDRAGSCRRRPPWPPQRASTGEPSSPCSRRAPRRRPRGRPTREPADAPPGQGPGVGRSAPPGLEEARFRSGRRPTMTRRSPRNGGSSMSGLTRARRHLLLSWAERRSGPSDRESARRPSRFLRALDVGPGGSMRRPLPVTAVRCAFED